MIIETLFGTEIHADDCECFACGERFDDLAGYND